VTSWLAHYGVFAVFVLMMIDAVFPTASELVMVYGGALASGALAHEVDVFGWHTTGLSAFLAVVFAGIAGYQLGAIGGWWIGYRGGRPFLERRGRWLHLTPARLDQADRWFDRWDDLAVFIGRVTPVARSFISIPAGVFGMPLIRYVVLTLVGSAIWAFALAGAGYGLGTRYGHFDHAFRYAEHAVVLAVMGAALVLVVRAVRTHAARSRL
jgi:membrane protein DedA with SNARE-associated domain